MMTTGARSRDVTSVVVIATSPPICQSWISILLIQKRRRRRRLVSGILSTRIGHRKTPSLPMCSTVSKILLL